MTLSRGSHPPIEAHQVYKIPEIISPYILGTSDAIARQWYWVASSTTLSMEWMDHYRYIESQYQWDHTSYSTKPSGVFRLQRLLIEGWRLQFEGSHRLSHTATWVIWPLDRGKSPENLSGRWMSRGWAWHARLLASSLLLHGIQNVAGDTYSDQTGTSIVSTYHRRKGRGIAMKKRSVHVKDTMRPGQMLLTPVGLTPEILQPTCVVW